MKALFLIISVLVSSGAFATDTGSESRELVLPPPLKGERVPEQKWKFESATTQCDAGHGSKTVGKNNNCMNNNLVNVKAQDSAFEASRTYDPATPTSTETYTYEIKSGK